MNFDKHLSRHPRAYVETLEKSTQIKALMYSNNATINMAETIGTERLSALLDSSAQLARYAYDLQQKKFRRFTRYFTQDYYLGEMHIQKICSRMPNSAFYCAALKTQHGNVASARSPTLHGIMDTLSEKTIRDLITAEVGYSFQGSAHNLLTVSSILSTIGRIVDTNFEPEKLITRHKSNPDEMTA